ncbi:MULTISPECIES: hypothetical protein [unclassified Mycobacterium]|uniref:hypothetical protein n=1 Tax=unclassified Mycobacterium TaxID=2642494 RepID=UPI0029C8E0E9|nr:MULTISPECIES: hypothetical protein [unclassified Mycobacterium]
MVSIEARPSADHRLDFVDQAMFLGLRATGQAAVTQIAWVYDHPVDMEEVRRFHRDFGYGLAGRLIEPSALPFGRHRWVASPGPAAPLAIESSPRPRSELSDWIDERAQLPIDPEFGPGWHAGVLPMTDGSTAVTLVMSHLLFDGGAALSTIHDAIRGHRRDFGYPPPRTRTRRQAMAADARQTLRDAPELGRTLVAAAKFLMSHRKDGSARDTKDRSSASPAQPTGRSGRRAADDEAVVVPAVSAFIALDEWDARAEALGGNSYSLLAGFAAKLAVDQGRELVADGTVGLIVPINDRAPDDTRANAVALAQVRVDPRLITTDLSSTRAVVRDALKAVKDEPDEAMRLLPLTPFIPKFAVRRVADLAIGFAEQPVSCSNLGDLPIGIACLDGTPAEQVFLRGVDRHITRRVLEERHGLLTIVSGRLDGKVSIAVIGYQPGVENTKEGLRARVARVLGEFDLRGVIV